MEWPKLSIIIATLNNERTLDICLKSIRRQHYPQNKLEIILVDGGSSDSTLSIGASRGAKAILHPGVRSEAAKAHGLREAKGELVGDFGADNILPEKNWLKKIVYPLIAEPKVIASYPLRYHYRPMDSPFNRYTALFGVNDPVPFYLGKADRQAYLYSGYQLTGNVLKEKRRTNKQGFLNNSGKHPNSYVEIEQHVLTDFNSYRYYVLQFTPKNLPTVGANGFIIRKNILQKAKVEPDNYFHIDVVYDLVNIGYDKFAVVETSIIHDTADSLFLLLSKRRRYLQQLYLARSDKRRYHIVDEGDYDNLALFILYSLTFVQPLYLSIKGFLKKPDLAWFLHPIFCFSMTVVYTFSFVEHKIYNLFVSNDNPKWQK